MKELLKFEYLFAFLVVIVLSIALFIFKDTDLRNTVLTALVGALSAITTFFYTKHNPTKG